MENRIQAVVTFLGLLELLNLQQIGIVLGEGTNNFWLVPHEEANNETDDAINSDLITKDKV